MLKRLLFFAYVPWCQMRSLLQQREVTSETISMSIAASGSCSSRAREQARL